MTIQITDILEVNLTLVGISLLNSPEGVTEFRRAVRVELSQVSMGIPLPVEIPFPEGLPIPRQRFDLERDRISVGVSDDRSTISRKYPTRKDLERLTEVASLAIDNTLLEDQHLRAYGFNLDLIGKLNEDLTVGALVGKHVFGPNLGRILGGDVVGGLARIAFNAGGEIWNLRIEPRANDESGSMLFIGLNLHRAEGRIPTSAGIRKSLEETWDKSVEIVQRLGREDRSQS